MFKIIQQRDTLGRITDKYTVTCFVYDDITNKNIQVWEASNQSEADICFILIGRSDKQLEDLDFAFTVVKSGNGPAILAESGGLIPQPVRSKHAYTPHKSHVWRKDELMSKRRKKIVNH